MVSLEKRVEDMKTKSLTCQKTAYMCQADTRNTTMHRNRWCRYQAYKQCTPVSAETTNTNQDCSSNHMKERSK
jgi:hypothetical protein